MRTSMRSVIALLTVLALSLLPQAGQAIIANHDRIPTAVPAASTPGVSNGEVLAIAQVGSTIVAGGTFTNVTAPGGGGAVTRNYVFAFNASTGQISSGFVPAVNGQIEDVIPGPTAGTVYIAGGFNRVNDTGASHIALLNVNDGSLVSGFRAAATNGKVNAVVRVGNRLILGGNFTTAGGLTHQGLASLNATTGALDPYVDLHVTERHNTGSGARGSIGVKDLAASNKGDRLVVIGNFRKVNGNLRDQVALVNLGAGSATLDMNWRTRRYEPLCYNWAFDSYVRGVDISPDDRYFVIATTGGHNNGTLCDTASRFELYGSGQEVQPTWISDTGGDTLVAVAVTEKAVFVGGHQRWMNNHNGRDYAAPGAVPRPGLAAVNTETGVPLAWNPGRNPRGTAVYALLATPQGLWLGSDTEWIGNREYRRPRLAYFPLNGGLPEAPDDQNSLPGTVYVAGRLQNPPASRLNTIQFNGTTAGAAAVANGLGVDWSQMRGAFLIGQNLYYGWSDGRFYKRTFSANGVGPATYLNPYQDPKWNDVDTGSGQTYRGSITPFYAQLPNVTGMFYRQGRIYYTLNNNANLYWRNFNVDSGIVSPIQNTANGGINWSTTSGLFANGDTLYVVNKSNGSLSRVNFAGGTPQGSLTTVNTTNDWRARALFIGDGVAPNQAPTARFTVSCNELTCAVDGRTSSDPEGSALTYGWSFGDGATATGSTASRTYAADGSYSIALTVTDNAGLSHTTTQTVQVQAAPPVPSSISFVGSASSNALTSTAQVRVPSQVQAGDQLVLFGSGLDLVTPSGWTLVSSRAANGMESHAWTRRATATDAGSTVTVSATYDKTVLAVSAYRGVSATSPVAAVESNTATGVTQHVTPTVNAPQNAWVLQFWSNKSSTVTSMPPPASVTTRESTVGAGGGRKSAILADSNSGVAAGQAGGATATTDAASGRTINWTLALRPQ